jgi:hypothetical protein
MMWTAPPLALEFHMKVSAAENCEIVAWVKIARVRTSARLQKLFGCLRTADHICLM